MFQRSLFRDRHSHEIVRQSFLFKSVSRKYALIVRHYSKGDKDSRAHHDRCKTAVTAVILVFDYFILYENPLCSLVQVIEEDLRNRISSIMSQFRRRKRA
jgi:hypothetical protein